jgi:predicted O-linked N-acetylglucosamine transferase (SPINDLY family)
MGVPVVALAGNRHAARVGVSLLTQVGLTELIAKSPDDYVRIATELAGDLDRLAALRMGLRERMRNSPLCDARTFTRNLEQAYREMWRKWCSERRTAIS